MKLAGGRVGGGWLTLCLILRRQPRCRRVQLPRRREPAPQLRPGRPVAVGQRAGAEAATQVATKQAQHWQWRRRRSAAVRLRGPTLQRLPQRRRLHQHQAGDVRRGHAAPGQRSLQHQTPPAAHQPAWRFTPHWPVSGTESARGAAAVRGIVYILCSTAELRFKGGTSQRSLFLCPGRVAACEPNTEKMQSLEQADASAAQKMMECSLCGLAVLYEVFGRRLPVLEPQIEWREDAYLRSDPFSSRRRPLAVGGRCSVCARDVCVAATCSLFCDRRFCLPCARANRDALPAALRAELDKQP